MGAMETTGHRGIRHAIWHQAPFTLGACQSKKTTCLWRSAGSLERLYTPKPKPPPPRLNPLGARHLHSPYPSMCSLSSLSVPPFLQWLVSSNPMSTVPKSYSHILSLSLASSYASQNLNLEKGEPQKELSFTFANQIRFKMVRRYESHS